MCRVVFCVGAVVVWAAGFAVAQDSGKPQKSMDPVGAEVRLLDGSAIRMTILQKEIEVKTDYGLLTVPVKDIVKIDFGVHLPDGLEDKIAAAIEKLADENYKAREGALMDLIGWGPYAYPQLQRATKSTVP